MIRKSVETGILAYLVWVFYNTNRKAKRNRMDEHNDAE